MSLQDSKQVSDIKVMLKTGLDGAGIYSIEKTSTEGLVDTYTITFDDGRTSDFEVTNGSSIASIEKTSTSGNVDTYTITLTNGDTSTFTVTNGDPEEYPASKVVYDNTGTQIVATKVQGAITELATDLTANGLMFKFSKSGNAYGYKDENDNFVPFKNPIGTKSITANGTYDVAEYASAEVNVPSQAPTGTINITSNGTKDVTNYATANVNVPNSNSGTYTANSVGAALDMGAANTYRYVDTRPVFILGQKNPSFAVGEQFYITTTVYKEIIQRDTDYIFIAYKASNVTFDIEVSGTILYQEYTANGYFSIFRTPATGSPYVKASIRTSAQAYGVLVKVSST